MFKLRRMRTLLPKSVKCLQTFEEGLPRGDKTTMGHRQCEKVSERSVLNPVTSSDIGRLKAEQ